jgi:hypothetical protein
MIFIQKASFELCSKRGKNPPLDTAYYPRGIKSKKRNILLHILSFVFTHNLLLYEIFVHDNVLKNGGPLYFLYIH